MLGGQRGDRDRDERVEELDDLAQELCNRGFRVEQEAKRLRTELEGRLADVRRSEEIVRVTNISVQELWRSVDDCARLQSSTAAHSSALQEEQRLDSKHMALAGEQSVQQEVTRLTDLEAGASAVAQEVKRQEREAHITASLLRVLRDARAQRVATLQTADARGSERAGSELLEGIRAARVAEDACMNLSLPDTQALLDASSRSADAVLAGASAAIAAKQSPALAFEALKEAARARKDASRLLGELMELRRGEGRQSIATKRSSVP